tara:strand:- start:1542 stop:2108 length:567 start_codon:yes stop_codon:yes gene_type:complete
MKKIFSIFANKQPLEIIIFAVVFFAILFYAYNYFSRLNTAYACFDQSKKPYLLFFFHPTQKITGENTDWVKDGISNYDQDDWTTEKIKKQNNQMHYFQKNTYSNDTLYFEWKSKKGENFSLPINTYRTVVFDKKKETYKTYEYKNFRYQTEKFLLNNKEDEGFKIIIEIKKELECEEDKVLYKKFAKI